MAACSPAPEDTGVPFEVVGVFPTDGTEAVESVSPELRLSAAVATCEGVRLDGLDAGSTVLFPVPVALSTEGARVLLDPEGGLPRGWTYAVSVPEGGCSDTEGRDVAPFQSTFSVP